jgi:NAD(P)-dependent dehydrogenase (short-subunit alcohol dehydrogenase family)
VLFTYELAGRLAGTGVTANCLHPGFVATNFFANNWGAAGKVLRRAMNLFSISVEEGARTIIKLASSPEVEGMSGQYFTNGKPVSSSRASYDEDAQRRLWDMSVELAGLEG